MAEDLNDYFISVFTKEDISLLPLPVKYKLITEFQHGFLKARSCLA